MGCLQRSKTFYQVEKFFEKEPFFQCLGVWIIFKKDPIHKKILSFIKKTVLTSYRKHVKIICLIGGLNPLRVSYLSVVLPHTYITQANNDFALQREKSALCGQIQEKEKNSK